MTESSVRVAVRIRPQTSSEFLDQCHVCTSVTPGEPQVLLGSDKAFTFDHVFNMNATQDTVYMSCIQDLLDGCFKGFNATILAYGQTGSGKTYTMGTGFEVSVKEEEVGIIPRAVNQLFSVIAKMQNDARAQNTTPPDFQVMAQFMELYNEEVIDLLDSVGESEDKGKKSGVKIHEDVNGQIVAAGLTSRSVSSASETLQCLKIGALSRTTASTKMNVQSSRSHAIFTLHIKLQKISEFKDSEELDSMEEFDTFTSKLHFVDLAGSERLKRTGATGDRAKEGISINCGLLALGNVISALGDKTRRATHVPYRDSKLTRLLQDSLGGNSQTLMIACVSPSDRDFMETLNTLKYANRAKNIRNKIMVNQDKSSQTISSLRREVQQLQLELMEYKQGKRVIGDNGEEHVNDMFHENKFLETENNNLRSRLKALQETLDHQTKRVTDLLSEKAAGQWITLGDNPSQSDITEMIKGYMKEIEDLRVKLLEAEETCMQLRKQVQRNQAAKVSFNGSPILMGDLQRSFESPRSPYEILREAKEDVRVLTKHVKNIGKKGEDNEADEEKEKEDAPRVNGDVENEDLDDEEGDEDAEEESSDESESEEKSFADAYGGDLAQLTQDISIKQKLIEALEQSQHRLRMMRRSYEEKLQQLANKIKETQSERDKILSDLTAKKGSRSEEKVRKVKEEFEQRLSSLQSELRKMQVIRKEHTQAMRNQATAERQIQTLRNEVSEMKRTKVNLIHKMREETKKHMLAEQNRNKEIAQLKKQGRLKENQIRNLEAEKKVKETVLKRKQEEIIALRRANRPLSDKVAGRVAQPDPNTTFILNRRNMQSPKMGKSRWQSLEKSINQLVISRQSINNTARDMERYLKDRDNMIKKIALLKEKREAATRQKKDIDIIREYDDNIDSLKSTIKYYQENISECQSTIVQMEETKDDNDLLDVEKFVEGLRPVETKYLLGKILNMAINQSLEVARKENAIKELNAKLQDSNNHNNVYMEYLERLFKEGKTEILDFIFEDDDEDNSENCSQHSSRSSSPIESSVSEAVTFLVPGDRVPTKRKEKRKHRKTSIFPQDITADQLGLTPANSLPSVNEPSTNQLMEPRMAWSVGPSLKEDLDKTITISTHCESETPSTLIKRVPSAPTTLQDMYIKHTSSPLARRRSREKNSAISDLSPAFARKVYSNASVIPLPNLSRQNST